MATKPKIFIAEQARNSIVSFVEKPEVIRVFEGKKARDQVLKSSLSVRDLARQRQEDRHIDQAVRAMPVQV